jgi:hypothetical protein
MKRLFLLLAVLVCLSQLGCECCDWCRSSSCYSPYARPAAVMQAQPNCCVPCTPCCPQGTVPAVVAPGAYAPPAVAPGAYAPTTVAPATVAPR